MVLRGKGISLTASASQVSTTGYSPFPGTPPISFNQGRKTKATKTDKAIEKEVSQIPDESTLATTTEQEKIIPHPDLAPYWPQLSEEDKKKIIEYMKKGYTAQDIIGAIR